MYPKLVHLEKPERAKMCNQCFGFSLFGNERLTVVSGTISEFSDTVTVGCRSVHSLGFLAKDRLDGWFLLDRRSTLEKLF